MGSKSDFYRLLPGRQYSPSIGELLKSAPEHLKHFTEEWKPLIANFREARSLKLKRHTVGVFGEGARPLELIRRLLMRRKGVKGKLLSGDYFRLKFLVLDAGGRNSKVRYAHYGQDIRYCQHLFEWLGNELGIPVYSKPIKRYCSAAKAMVVTEEFYEWFRRRCPDLVLMSTFGYLIPEELFELVRNWWINFHPAEETVQWPKTDFRGPKPYPKMLAQGIDRMVAVAYFIDGEFDHGSFLAKSAPRSLHQACKEALGEVRKPRNDDEWFKLLTRCHQVMAEPTGQLLQDLSMALVQGLRKQQHDKSYSIEKFKSEHESGFFSSAG